MAPNKDPYSILGVSADVSDAEIRAAYMARLRVIHPDRFDKDKQPAEWKKANEMQADLNEAYDALRNAKTREAYDRKRRASTVPKPSSPVTSSSPPKSPAHGNRSTYRHTGYYRFRDLPTTIQQKLRARQLDKDLDQLRTPLKTITANIFFVALLLAWFVYLFVAASDSHRWSGQALFWLSTITLLVGGMLGANAVTIMRWRLSTLTPALYVTRLYFIKTGFDTVSFWPFWNFKDLAITHNYSNGSYQSSQVLLKFEGREELLTLNSEEKVRSLVERMRIYDNDLRAAIRSQNDLYSLVHDDFCELSSPPSYFRECDAMSRITPAQYCATYGVPLSLSLVLLIIARTINAQAADDRWVRHSLPQAVTPASSRPTLSTPSSRPPFVAKAKRPQRVGNSPIPTQALPRNGSTKLFTNAACVAPFEIKAAPGSHHLVKLVDSNLGTPVLTVFVRGGMTADIQVPLGIYEVRYASGDVWYGYEYLFGPVPDTAYSKADTSFDFRVDGNQVQGYTITLYKVANGNLRTSTIAATEF